MKMFRPVMLISYMCYAVFLTGCSNTGQEDINRWMVEQRGQIRPAIVPIIEPKKFTPQAYTEGNSYEPFNIQKLTMALKRDTNRAINSALITPELSRRKEPLESFPLDSVNMVGSLNKGLQQVALVQSEKMLYQVQTGNYLGLNYGRITKVTETEITVREIVQDASGEWIERMAKLQLQEKSK